MLKTIGMDYLKIKNGVLIGCIGALLLAIGDWLIGYIDPTIIGDSMILVKGCRNVGYIRPVLSMLFAMVGAIMCTYGMLCKSDTIQSESKFKSLYKYSVIFGALQWIFIHFIFCGFRYQYQYLWNENYGELACDAINKVTEAFMPIILLSFMIIIIPFVVYFLALLRKKTLFPRWMTICYMFTFSVIFKIVAQILGDTSISNGFSTSSNNMAIAIWFLCVYVYLSKFHRENKNKF